MAGKHICLLVHFTWSTKDREPMISPEWNDRLYGYIGGVLESKKGKLLRAGGMPDHVHLYTSLPSTASIADLVNAMKANSSRWVHQNFKKYRSFAWQEGYGAFSVSKSVEEKLIRYIRNQESHHRQRSFKKEFVTLLAKHGIEYDERYLWL